MQNLLDRISEETGAAFAAAGYDSALGRTTVSNRPDLCEFQCNGAMAGAKQYHKAPFMIADEVAAKLAEQGENSIFSSAESVKPGFLNLRLKESFLASWLNEVEQSEKYGLQLPEKQRKIVLDYGGPNVAKPLHVGHLRSAVIGESLKRILRYCGNDVTGDIHLGDWGLQMGLVITELKKRQPELPYFDSSFTGEYPAEAPFTVSDLEEIYPTASKKSKEDSAYYAEAMENTHLLQEGNRGYLALWQKIIDISVTDMKRVYKMLDVSFDLWNGESTVNDLIPEMVEKMKKDGFAHESNGALVVDVAEESDAKEMPPCIILKSDGAALYTTTDLATIVDREEKYDPDMLLYVTDKRQELHFMQVFRAAKICGIVRPETELKHIGFGTVNGKDGKPFKTRDGGVPRLESLIDEINTEMLKKIRTNEEIPEDEQAATARQVAMAALKYGDLSNQASKDYVFDMEKFMSFEGDTGPYILYTMVRIKSILAKYAEQPGAKAPESLPIGNAQSALEKNLMMTLARFSETMQAVCAECAPHRLCAYVYGLCNDFNSFYHETRILTETEEAKKESWIALLRLTLGVLNDCIGCLGFSCPERM
jgi:arginyl-tRNA synthetase